MANRVFAAALLVAGLCAPAAPAAGADPVDAGLINLSRPDVNFVMGLRVSKIAASPLLHATLAQAGAAQGNWGQFMAGLDGEALAEVDEVLVTSKVDHLSQAGGDEDALILLRGDFSRGRLADLMCSRGCAPEEYRSLELYRCTSQECMEGDGPTHFAFLDSNYAVMGAESEVRGAVDRRAMETESVFSDGMQAWVARLAGYHLWVAAQGPFAPPAAATGPGALAAAAADKVDGFGFGITLGSKVQVGLELHSPSVADATDLYDLAEAFLAIAAMKSPADEEPAAGGDWLKNLKLTQHASFITAALTIPEAEVWKKMKEMPAGAAFSWGGSEPAATVEPPRAPRREGGIRIYGLGNDPVEVPTAPVEP